MALKKDSLTFSTAYISGHTNKQLVSFNLEVLNTSDRILKYLKESTEYERGEIISVFLLLFYVNYKAGVAFHEIGHGLRSKSFGLDYELIQNSTNVYNNFEKDENFLSFFNRII